jgi:hypothetical protein
MGESTTTMSRAHAPRLTRASLLLALLLGGVAGCSQPLHHFAFPPGRTQQDFERDARLCNLDDRSDLAVEHLVRRADAWADRPALRGVHDEARLPGADAADEAVKRP